MTGDELVRAALSEAKSYDMRALPSFESILARPASRRARLIASPMVSMASFGISRKRSSKEIRSHDSCSRRNW